MINNMPMTSAGEQAVDPNPQLLNQVKNFNEEFYGSVRERFLQDSADYFAAVPDSRCE